VAKREKLLQYAERVWHILDGDDESRIDQAIENTVQFFKEMQVPTSLKEVELDARHIDDILAKLKQHGMVALGEKRDVTLDVSREILEAAL